MSTDRDVTRIVRSWMDEGATQLPDRVLDAVLDQLPATPQRRSSWLTRRFSLMNNNLVRYGLAAAAVLVIAFIGIQLIGGPAPGGPPPESPSVAPSVAPSATPVATPAPSITPTLEAEMGALFAGSYLITDVEPFTITIALPDGWESLSVPAQVWGPGSAVGYWTLDDLFADPCDPTQGHLGVGPTVDDLVQALTTYPGLTVDQTTDVTVSGYSGSLVQLTGSDVDCGGGSSEAFFATSQPGSIDRPHPGAGTEFQMTILDVAGDRLVILARVDADAPPDTAAEVESIVESTVIEAP